MRSQNKSKKKEINKPIIFHASASAGTQSGLVFGIQTIGAEIPIIGVNVYHKNSQNLHQKIMEIVSELQTEHKGSGLVSIPEDTVNIDNSYLGEGYGLPSKKTLDAIRLAASLEGIALILSIQAKPWKPSLIKPYWGTWTTTRT